MEARGWHGHVVKGPGSLNDLTGVNSDPVTPPAGPEMTSCCPAAWGDGRHIAVAGSQLIATGLKRQGADPASVLLHPLPITFG